jgi:chemosensory pili system protein ChpA (sensor histidine kinase/response regulator)
MYDDALSKVQFDAAPQIARDEVAAEPLALLWLHAPLEMAWKQIETAFEQFVSSPQSPELLAGAREQLVALQGLFTLLDDPVARLSTLEILRVLEMLQAGKIQTDETCVEAVMLALLRLRVFVDLRRRDRPVTDLALLESFNRLRILGGHDVMDAQTFLEYVSVLAASPTTVRSAPLAEFQASAKDLRQRLDKNLVAWLKRDPKAHLAVASVFNQALHLAPSREEALLWWSAWHLAHVMQMVDVLHASALKPVLGRVNRFLKKRVTDEAHEFAAADVLDVLDLVHELTLLLATRASTVPSVVRMLDDVQWPRQAPSPQAVAEADNLLLVADGEIFVQAAEQVQAALLPVQDRFDLALRVDDSAAIFDLAPDLEQLSAILGVLELSDISGLLASSAQRLRSAGQSGEALSPDDYEDIASALMRVEIELARLRLNVAEGMGDADSSAPVLGDATRALIEQALADLLRSKEQLLNQSAQHNTQAAADLLAGVGASFGMLGLPVWLSLVDGLRDFIAHLAERDVLFAEVQDRVADVFASLEYGLENFRDFQRAPQTVLASGQQALSALQASVGELDFDLVPLPLAVTPAVTQTDIPDDIVSEQVPVIEPHVEAIDGTVTDVSADEVEIRTDLPKLVPDDVDAEILEIFVEEGREIQEALHSQFARLQAQPADREALAGLRRSFHTIKGSGRIVGARLVGEFGWAFEHLLNQALEGALSVDTQFFGLLARAETQFDKLLNALEGRPGVCVDVVETVCRQVLDFADGKGGMVVPMETVAHEPELLSEPVIVPVSEVSPPVPRIDAQLYEIFRNEVVEYLDYLEAAAARGENEGGLYADHELLRVTHSLLGGSRTAQAVRMKTLVEQLEHLVRAAGDHQRALQGNDLELVRQTVQTVRILVDDLGGICVDVPDSHALEAALVQAVANMQANMQLEETGALMEHVPHGADAVVVPTVAGVIELQEAVAASEPYEAVAASEVGAAEEINTALETAAAYVPIHEPAFDMPAEQDAELLEIFAEEATEILEQLDETLAAWQKDPEARVYQQTLQRHLHTFKGGARMAGLMHMGELTHTLEDVFADIETKNYPVTPVIQGLMQRVFDKLHHMVAQLHSRQPIPAEHELMDALHHLRANNGVLDASMATQFRAAAPVSIVESAPAKAVLEESAQDSSGSVERDEAHALSARAELVRLRADVLDQMVASAGETAIQHVRLSQKFVGLAQQISELEQTLERLRAQLRRVEIENEAQMLWRFQHETGLSSEDFDPLEFDRFTVQQELGRGVMESLADIESIKSVLSADVRDAEMVLVQQGRIGQVLQDSLMKARLVRFSTVIPRLKRVVRQVATELGKHAELEVIGADVEVEGGLLNTLVPAFEHMLRNSLAHGIELPARREQLGKSVVGKIKLQLTTDSGYLLVNMHDDGAGIDLDALRRKASEGGFLTPQAAENDDAAMQLIFRSGISTAKAVSMVAGRGVGMDVVADSLRQVGGDIQVSSRFGQGANFRMNIPLTQAIARGIAVRAAGQAFAFPYAVIESIERAPQRELAAALEEEKPAYEYAGELYPLLDLANLLRLTDRVSSAVEGMTPLLILRIGERRMALRVDGLLGSQQLFIKSLGPFVARLPALAGASLLGDGSIVLVLDVAEMFRLAETVRTQAVHQQTVSSEPRVTRPIVLVVDDSVTIRKVTERILQRYDIDVATAKDGVDALSYLHEHRPTIVLSDIEMPRMDGFELLASIRNDASLHNLPVVMITSRTGVKHREKAESLGVQGYLGKPYSEAELMATLSAWLPAGTVSGQTLKAQAATKSVSTGDAV